MDIASSGLVARNMKDDINGTKKLDSEADSAVDGGLERPLVNKSSCINPVKIHKNFQAMEDLSSSDSASSIANAKRGYLNRISKRFKNMVRFLPISGDKKSDGIEDTNIFDPLFIAGQDDEVLLRETGAYDEIHQSLKDKVKERFLETNAPIPEMQVITDEQGNPILDISGRKGLIEQAVDDMILEGNITRVEASRMLRSVKDVDGNNKYGKSLLSDYLDILYDTPLPEPVSHKLVDTATSINVDQTVDCKLTPEAEVLFGIDSRKAANAIMKKRKTLKAYEGVTYFLKTKYFFTKRDPALINNMVRDARTHMSGKGKALNSEEDYYILTQAVMAAFLIDSQELKFRALMKNRDNLDNIKHLNAAAQGDLGFTSVLAPLGRRTDRLKHAFMEHNTFSSMTKMDV